MGGRGQRDPAEGVAGMERAGMIQGLAAELRASPGKGRNMLVLKEGNNTQGLGSRAHPDPIGISEVIVTSLACGNT